MAAKTDPIPETVDLTPTDMGFARIMVVLLDQILSNTTTKKTSRAALLSSVLDIARYLSQKNPVEFDRIIKDLDELSHESK